MEKTSNEEIISRLDSIDEVLKLLVVNSISDELENVTHSKKDDRIDEKNVCCFPKELLDYLIDNEYRIKKIEVNNGFWLVYIQSESDVGSKTKKMTEINDYIRYYWDCENIVPVFCFDTLNGNQRSLLCQRSISFQINNKEIHICTR